MSNHQGFRSDIQGMRAIAVILVVIYHIFPTAMPGGYVGVDVFFVISGFLICGLILKDAEKNGRFNALDFYDRRIRRLLPAASAMLIVTAIFSYFLLPQTRWIDTGREIIASTLYVENLYLHFQSIDYLTADKPPSPLQHFWSLSVEEQFYIFWPLLMVMMVLVSKKTNLNLRAIVTSLLVLIFAGSLLSSITITAQNPAEAYFVTYTRVWELAIGGILACMLPYIKISKFLQFVLSFVGLVMVFIAGFLFTKHTPFPSYYALLPTVGITFLLWAGITMVGASPGPIQRVLSLKPITFIGDISYSLYLWHWPIVIFATVLFGKDFSLLIGLGVLLLSIVLATLSKIWLEDPIRRTIKIKTRLESYLLGLSLMALTIIAGLLLILAPSHHDTTTNLDTVQFSSSYPGALAINQTIDQPPENTPVFIPTLDKVRGDIAVTYAHGCHTAQQDTEPTPCYYEPKRIEDGTTTMSRVEVLSGKTDKTLAVVGDSHAAHWLPAIRQIASHNNYAVVSFTKSSCAFTDVDTHVGTTPYPECRVWSDKVVESILVIKPDLVVTSMVSNHRALGGHYDELNQAILGQGLSDIWRRLEVSGIQVAAIKETPRFTDLVPDCVAGNLSDPNECAQPREEVMRASGAIEAGTKLARNATLVDMTDYICTAQECPVIVGNVLVYRDQHHLTATYAKTLSKPLEKKLNALMKHNSAVNVDVVQFSSSYPGALAINQTINPPPANTPAFMPTLDKVRGDIAVTYAHGCHTAQTDTNPTPCYYEPQMIEDGSITMRQVEALSNETDKTLIVVGDSHAAHWLPTIRQIATRNNYAVVSFTKSSCAFVNVDTYHAGRVYQECRVWSDKVVERILAIKPDLVITSMISNHRAVGGHNDALNQAILGQGLADIWMRLEPVGIQVAAIRETPRFTNLVPDCVAVNLNEPTKCTLSREEAMRTSGAIEEGTKLARNAKLLDMTDHICTAQECPVIIGNVLIYRDQHHLTATYAKTLSKPLEKKLKVLMK